MRLKRILITLSAVVCIAFSATAVNAAASDDTAEKVYDKMVGLKLLEDSDRVDTEYMLRGDFVRLAMKVADVSVGDTGEDMYADLNSTGQNRIYINTACQLGYISGGGNFNPNQPVKFNEAIKIMTEILGYGIFAEKEGGYPQGYLTAASRSGLLDGLSAVDYDALTLSEGLAIIDSALDAYITERVIQSHGIDKIYVSDMTLADYLNIGKAEGVVSECGGTGLYSSGMYNDKMICVDNLYLRVENPHDFDGLLGMNCRAYYIDDKDAGTKTVGYIEERDDKNTVLVLDADNSDYATKKYTYYENGRKKTAKLSDEYSLIYNGCFSEPKNSLMSTDNGFVKLVDNDDDGKYDVVFVYSFTTYILDDVNATDSKLITKSGERLEIEEDSDNYVYLYVDGEVGSIDMIAAPVVVSYAESQNDGRRVKTVYVSSASVSGTLSTVSSEELEIDAQTYKTYKSVAAGFSPNTSGTFYLDSFDRVVYCEVGAMKYEYGYLMSGWREYDADDAPCGVKIYTTKGTFEKYTIADKCSYNGNKMSADRLIATLDTDGVYKQFIRYKRDDNGNIKQLETAEELAVFTDKGEEGRINDTFRISASGNDKFYISNYSLNMKLIIGPSTKVFFIPTTGNEDHFLVGTRVYLSNEKVYTYKAYNADEYGTAEFLVCDIDYRANSSNYYIVKGTSVTLDSNGDECDTVQCYANGTLTEFKAAEGSNFDAARMERGDVIQVYVNAAGKVETFNVLWRYSESEPPEFMLNGTMTSDNIVGAEVVKFNRADSTMVVRKNEDYYIMSLTPSVVTAYDKGEWYEMPSGDITVGDYVVFKSAKSVISSLTVIK